MGRFRLNLVQGTVFASFAVVMVACGDGGGGEDSALEAAIVSFQTSSPQLTEGDSTTLSWETKRAASIRLSANGLLMPGDELPAVGQLEVSPKADTTYRLVATGASGASVMESLEVEVLPFGAPIVEAFAASHEAAARGDTVELSWSVRGAESVQISTKEGAPVATPDDPKEGSAEVQPTATTTYVLLARNAQGRTTEEVTVTVGRTPTVSLFSAEPVIEFGEEVALSWTAEGAERIQIVDPSGHVIHEGDGGQDTLTVSPQVTGRYVATATGPGGEVTAAARIGVRPIIEVFEVAALESHQIGDEVVVEWRARGAERLELSSPIGEPFPVEGPDGRMPLVLGAEGGFVLRAWNGDTAAEAVASVEVTSLPLVRSFGTTGVVTAGSGQSGVANVYWEVDAAAQVRLEVFPGGMLDLTDKSPRRDDMDVTFTGPGTLRLIASNNAGETVVEIPSPVDPVPTFERFFAAPSRVGMEEEVDLHWEINDAQMVILEQDGREVTIDPTAATGSFRTGPLYTSSSYQLRAFNGLGFEAISEPLHVELGAPNILSLETWDGRRLYPVGTEVELQWANDGGAHLTLTDRTTGQVVCQSSTALEIREGGCRISLPLVQELRTYELEVTNASGTDRHSLELHAVTGPIVEDFTVEFDEITEGEWLHFSWVVRPDVDGNVPTLTLVDQAGTSYDVRDVDALEGSKRFQIPVFGDYTFTLTATTPIPPAFPASVQATVYGVPTVDLISANPLFAEDEGDDIELSWETTHGVSLEVYLIDREGGSGALQFATDDAGLTQAGTATVNPTIATPNVRVVATNPLGVSTSSDHRIDVNPATVASFTASAVDILAGEEVTLSWEVLRATGLNLGGYLDLSDRPYSTEVSWPQNDDTFLTVPFPQGFAFPLFDHPTPFTELRVNDNGWASFHTSPTSSYSNISFPITTGTGAHIHIAPFWDDLALAASTPVGTVFWELLETDGERVLVVQWTNINRWSESGSNKNFQAWLYEDGSVEYRYGGMQASTTALANGSSATIGIQGWMGDPFELVSYNTEILGGLSGKAFRFDPGPNPYVEREYPPHPLPDEGSWTFTPTESQTYSLHAWNGHSDHGLSVTVNVHEPGSLEVWTAPSMPAPGDAVSLHWQGQNLSSLVLEDETGAEILVVPPSQRAAGSFDLGPLAEGDYTFTFRAVGSAPFDQMEEVVEIFVYDPFSIESFSASADSIKIGEPLTLSWETTNVHSATITEVDAGIVYTVPAGDLAAGSHAPTPTRSTRYVLRAESHGRVLEESLDVAVRSIWFDSLDAPMMIPADGTATVSWSASGPGAVRILEYGEMPVEDMAEVTGQSEAAFVDISSTGTRLRATSLSASAYQEASFSGGFRFPYFGNTYDTFVVSGTGILSFDRDISGWKFNTTTIPNAAEAEVHLPVYWADTEGTGAGVYGQHFPGPNEHYVIQWTDFQEWSGSAGGTGSYQIALFADGAVEYRYGVMSGFMSGGSIATVGVQRPDGGEATLLHRGGTLPGGFANRSWRWEPSTLPADGSVSLPPGRYTICVDDGSWEECEEITINGVGPGSLLITELMIDPAGGVAEQWFEVGNASRGSIDLDGMEIHMGASSHTIQTGSPFLIEPGEVVVFARSIAPGLVPGYVYGGTPSMDMLLPDGDVSISWDGQTLAMVDWDGSWPISQGATLELGPTELRGDTVSWTNVSIYSAGAIPYDGTNLGTPGEAGVMDTPSYVVETFSSLPFIDISHTGQSVPALTADSGRAGATLPFSMPFFDQAYDSVWIDANGWLSFAPTQPSVEHFSPSSLPRSSSATPAGPLIAAFWDDLGCTQTPDPASFLYDTRTRDGLDVVIFQWNNARQCNQVGGITFQVQLWENGDVIIAFDEVWAADTTTARHRYAGNTAWIGLEPTDRTEHVTALHRRPQVFSGRTFAFLRK